MRDPGVRRCLLASAAVLFFTAGCAPSFGRFTETAYRVDEYPIAVHYEGGSAAKILGDDWLVENFNYVDGAPARQKVGPRYLVNRDYDTDGNGRPDTNVDELSWDLRLEHRREDAVIWLATIPLSAKDRDKMLSVLAVAPNNPPAVVKLPPTMTSP